MSKQPRLSEAQIAALKEIGRLAKANFASYIIVIRNTSEDQISSFDAQWHGHLTDVSGLAHMGANVVDDIARQEMRHIENEFKDDGEGVA